MPMLRLLNPFRSKRARVVPDPAGGGVATADAPEGSEVPQEKNTVTLPLHLPDAFKLSNTDDVFTCCDTDYSQFLDTHEARFGVNAFGLYPTPSMMQSAFAGATKIDRKTFAELVSKFQKATGADAPAKGRRAVPYSRRGLFLAELQALQDAYVTSNWLQERCDEGNNSGQRKFPLSINLYSFDEFIVRPSTTPGSEAPPTEFRSIAGTPQPKFLTSYSEVMHPNGVKIDFFVSHFWGHHFSDSMQALTHWADAKYGDVNKDEGRLVTFWICLFAINQHDAANEVGSTPEEGPFNAALQQAYGSVMIVDEELMPFSRIWCLFEVDRLSGSGKPFQLISSYGPLQKLVEDSFSEAKGVEAKMKAVEYVGRIGKRLGEISAFEAKASNEDDRMAIWHRIGDPTVSQLPMETMRAWIADNDGSIADVDFSEFDSRIGGLLAGPLFEMYLQMGDVAGTLQYLGLGAPFGEKHLLALQKLDCDPVTVKVRMRTAGDDWREDTELLHAAAWFGHMDAVQSLIRMNANIEAKDDLQWTPLHFATKCGKASVVQELLNAKADMEARDNAGDAVLHFASLNGRTQAAKLLLENGASYNKSGENGWKPIHLAAYGGFTDIVDLLIEHRADIGAKEDTAWTPLHYAAQNGVTKVVSRLLKLRANVGEAGEMGRIPLHLASGNGHLEAIRMLCESGSEVNKGDCDEDMPMHAACMKEKPRAIKMLVDFGADVHAANSNGRTPLHCISENAVAGQKLRGLDGMKREAAEVLLAARADIEAQDNNLRRPLHLAAEAGAPKLVECLLGKGADINTQTKRGWTALHVTASSCGFDYVEKTAEAEGQSKDEDADEEDKDEEEEGDDNDEEEEGDDAEEEADGAKDEEDNEGGADDEDEEEEEEKEYPNETQRVLVAKLLVSAKIDVGATSATGATALHVAVDQTQRDIAELLLESKAAVNVQRNDGRTPLHLAAANGDTQLVEMLVSRGASSDVTDTLGLLPSDLASKAGFDEIEESLLVDEASKMEGQYML